MIAITDSEVFFMKIFFKFLEANNDEFEQWPKNFICNFSNGEKILLSLIFRNFCNSVPTLNELLTNLWLSDRTGIPDI